MKTISQTDLAKIKDLLKGDLYLKDDGNMHGGSIILSNNGRNQNAKIAQIMVNEDLRADQDVVDFIIDNIVSVDVNKNSYFVRLNGDDSLVVQFITFSDFDVEACEFFLKF